MRETEKEKIRQKARHLRSQRGQGKGRQNQGKLRLKMKDGFLVGIYRLSLDELRILIAQSGPTRRKTRCQRGGQNRGPEDPKIKVLNSVKNPVVNGKIMY